MRPRSPSWWKDGSQAISGADPPPEWVARVSVELDNVRAAV